MASNAGNPPASFAGDGMRGVFLFGYFCLDKQEKVTAPPWHKRHSIKYAQRTSHKYSINNGAYDVANRQMREFIPGEK